MPIAQNNLLVTNALGETGAVFPGGIELTQTTGGGITDPPPNDRRIRWVKESSGALVAELHSREWGATDRLYLTQGSELVSAQEEVYIRAQNAADGPVNQTTPVANLTGIRVSRRSVADMPGGLSSVAAVAEGNLATVIDHDGGSDYLIKNRHQRFMMTGPWLLAPPPLFTGSAGGSFTVAATGNYLITLSGTLYASVAPATGAGLRFWVNGNGYMSSLLNPMTINAVQHVTTPTVRIRAFLSKSIVHWIGVEVVQGGSGTYASDSNDFCQVSIV